MFDSTDFLGYLPSLALAFAVVTLGLLSPGPNIMAIIGTSVRSGRKPGLALAMGVAVGSGLWAVLSVAGFSALLSKYAIVLMVFKIVGGLYLIWLGVKSFRSAMTEKDVGQQSLDLGVGWHGYFLRGLAIQMTNPKAAMAMLAIVSVGLGINSPLWVSVILVAGITSLSVVGHAIYAVAFSAKVVVTRYLKVRRWVEGALGMVFCFAGTRLLFSKN